MSEPDPMPTDLPALHLSDHPERSRYEATLGDDPTLAALLDYVMFDGRIMLTHTEVQEGFEGRGIGSRFARAVFEDARERGLKVIPKCPFIVRWLERHPEQHDVLLRPLGSPDPPEPESRPELA
jgi:predicted GNAT family acetyltransferase